MFRYSDPHGRLREILTRSGSAGTVLVIDRDATTHGDRQLVTHLAADEPLVNATLICRDYLSRPGGRLCRSLMPADMSIAPFAEGPNHASEAAPDQSFQDLEAEPVGAELLDGDGAELLDGRVGSTSYFPSLTASPSPNCAGIVSHLSAAAAIFTAAIFTGATFAAAIPKATIFTGAVPSYSVCAR